MPEIVGLIQAEWLLKRDAHLVKSIRHELGTDEAGLTLPLDVEIHRQKSQHIVGIDVAVVGEMADDQLVFFLLLLSNRDAVDLAGDKAVIAESALANDLLVEGRRKGEWAVCAAEAVHLRKPLIA